MMTPSPSPLLGASLLSLALLAAACGGAESTGPVTSGDTIAPSVVSTFPLEGTAGVSASTVLRVTFSEPILVQVGGSSGVALQSEGHSAFGSLRWTSPALIEFSPSYPLDLGSSYRATVRRIVTDTAGNPLPAEYTWTFGTMGSPLPAVDGDRMLEHVGVLAHDSMRGRFTGSPDELRAAYYIRDRFAELGLEPGAPGYLQRFQVDPAILGHDVESQNVIGILPGRGELAEEFVVVGAHYDHLGVEGGEVLNGADDNASGTAMMLELARVLARHAASGGLGQDDRRSVMFHGYGAEEVGLVGSNYFCANPTVPMSRIVGMLNLDMVGRLREDRLWVIGPLNGSTLGGLFPAVNYESLGLFYDLSLVNRSDQRCFILDGKPAAFLHTGLHGQYHTSFDDVELIDAAGMVRVGEVALRSLVKLILRPDPVGGS